MRRTRDTRSTLNERDRPGALLRLQSAALKVTAAATLLTDRGGIIVWVNPAFEQLTGYSTQEAVGHNASLLKSGQHPASFYEQMWETLLAGQRWRGEMVNRRKDGHLRQQEMTITPMRDRLGTVTHFVATLQDVTERKGADERSHLLAHAVENSSEMIGIADPEGHFTFVNHAFVQAHGYTEQEALGKHFGVVLSPRNPAAVLRDIGTKGLEPDGWRGECTLVRRDGGEFPAFLSVSPVTDPNGSAIGMLGIARDISERKRTEQLLRESEEQFRQLAEYISEVFFIFTLRPLRMTYISPAYDDVFGRPREEVYERPEAWTESIHAEDRERARAIFARALDGVPIDMEYRITRADGSLRWISARSFPVNDAEGRCARVVGIAEDITRRKHAEQELREAHTRLSRALGEAEHMATESARLTELVDILQSCQTLEEAYKVVESGLRTTLAARAGALCITSPSRNLVEVVVSWGDAPGSEKTFRPDDCWGLRRGRIHQVRDPVSPLRCRHVCAFPDAGYLCVPLAAQGETLGVLYVECAPRLDHPREGEIDSMARLRRQAGPAGERISLALANLRLRAVLRGQSIRDPLTGLFNRRYMEESLEREISRATRNKESVAFLMFDIDHFKRFNDTFGHQAGDALMRACGTFLGQHTRGQDVACRYGGEEFALILSGASVDDAVGRAELLRRDLTQLVVEHGGQVLGRVTFSIGIAVFPDHGATAEELVRVADAALYRAKVDGRDRVAVGS
jgi:diguanylate cyclase (GGDEF)-like protein/PAS domain S-box-containing protein